VTKGTTKNSSQPDHSEDNSSDIIDYSSDTSNGAKEERDKNVVSKKEKAGRKTKVVKKCHGFNIPENSPLTTELNSFVLKSFIQMYTSRINETEKDELVSIKMSKSNMSNENSRYLDESKFLIFKEGKIRLDYFKEFALKSVSSDIVRSIAQERVVLEFLLSVWPDEKSEVVLQMDNLATFFNDWSTIFFKFGEYAIAQESELSKAVEVIKNYQADSFLSLFIDPRNARKIFSKLYYGVVRRSCMEYLQRENLQSTTIYQTISNLALWSKYDCDSFLVDETQFNEENILMLISKNHSYPLSVMHDRIWEILNPSFQSLLEKSHHKNIKYPEIIDAKHNTILMLSTLYTTAEILYKNKTKRDLIPNYMSLFESLSEFVHKLIKYKIYSEIKVISDLNFTELKQYYRKPQSLLKAEQDDEIPEKMGRGKSLFKNMIADVKNSITAFDEIKQQKKSKKEKEVAKSREEQLQKDAMEQQRKVFQDYLIKEKEKLKFPVVNAKSIERPLELPGENTIDVTKLSLVNNSNNDLSSSSIDALKISPVNDVSLSDIQNVVVDESHKNNSEDNNSDLIDTTPISTTSQVL